jgi:preprotein translocase subunit SecG
MTTVLLIIHLFVTLALIGVVLIQRSEGGGLGIGTSQGMGGFMSGRGTANLLTRTTAILGAIFFGLSLTLALLNRGTVGVGRSLLDNPPPVTAPLNPAAAGPALSGTPLATTPATPPASAPAAPPAASESQPLPGAPAAPHAPAVPTN